MLQEAGRRQPVIRREAAPAARPGAGRPRPRGPPPPRCRFRRACSRRPGSASAARAAIPRRQRTADPAGLTTRTSTAPASTSSRAVDRAHRLIRGHGDADPPAKRRERPGSPPANGSSTYSRSNRPTAASRSAAVGGSQAPLTSSRTRTSARPRRRTARIRSTSASVSRSAPPLSFTSEPGLQRLARGFGRGRGSDEGDRRVDADAAPPGRSDRPRRTRGRTARRRARPEGPGPAAGGPRALAVGSRPPPDHRPPLAPATRARNGRLTVAGPEPPRRRPRGRRHRTADDPGLAGVPHPDGRRERPPEGTVTRSARSDGSASDAAVRRRASPAAKSTA